MKENQLLLHIEKEFQLKQVQVAEALGISKHLYGRLRGGHFELPAWRIMQLKKIFKLSTKEILDYLEKQYPDNVIRDYAATYKRRY